MAMNIEGGAAPKLSSWLYSTQRGKASPSASATDARRRNEEGARLLHVGKQPERIPQSEASDQSRNTAQPQLDPHIEALSVKGSSLEQPENLDEMDNIPIDSVGQDSQSLTGSDSSGQGGPATTFNFRVPAEAWRETEPGKELLTSTGQQFFDFCDSPSKSWACGIQVPSDVFGPPVNQSAQPTPRQLLPPRLFDLVENRVVSTTNFVETYYTIISHVWGNTILLDGQKYGTAWTIPVSSNDKLTKMLEFARLVGGERYVWVDILCMDPNQVNEAEIPRMKTYYTNASACLVWLDNAYGADEATWRGVLEAIKQINSFSHADEHFNPTITPQQMMTEGFLNLSMNSQQTLVFMETFAALEKAPWFKRVWTLQEAVIPETLVFCTPEKYMTRSSNLLTLISLTAMMVDLLSEQGSMIAVALLNNLQNSELWKLLRLRQLYRKRQVNFWHLFHAIKSRSCLRDQDRVLGILGLAQGVSVPIQSGQSSTELFRQLFKQYLGRNDFTTLFYINPSGTIDFDPAARGFVLSGALAGERRESHKMISTNEGLRIEGVGLESVYRVWSLVAHGDLIPWSRQFPSMADMSSADAVDVSRAWELNVDAHLEKYRILLVFIICCFGKIIPQIEQVFEKNSEEVYQQYLVSYYLSMAMWSSLGTVTGPTTTYAVVVLWTRFCGTLLAVITEEPQEELCIATPSSYVDKPGEGFILVTRSRNESSFKKIGVGVSTKVQPKHLDNILLKKQPSPTPVSPSSVSRGITPWSGQGGSTISIPTSQQFRASGHVSSADHKPSSSSSKSTFARLFRKRKS